MPERDSSGISAVLGILMVLAILASVITVIVVYKLPVIEKRAEFRHELEEIRAFRSFEKVYLGEPSDVNLELGAPSLPLLHVKMDSSLRVWNSGSIVVRISYALNNSSGTVTFRGRTFGVNLSVYPSLLPYYKLAMTPLGIVAYQSGFRENLTNFTLQYLESCIVNDGNTVKVYVDNYTVNGHLTNFTFAGTGFASLSAGVEENTTFTVRATKLTVSFEISDSLFGSRTVSRSFSNVSLMVIHRNYSVFVG